MVSKVSVFFLSFIASGALSASIDCNIDSCAKPSIVLEELGCKAVMGSKSCCPKRFDCPDFKKLDENTCSFEGKEYNIGEILPRSLASNTKCVETCFCTRQNNEPAKFSCTNSDCGVSSFELPGCLSIYGGISECCSTSVVCDEAEKESLATCFVGGKAYREGEKFIPESHKCYECLCHKDFDNTTIVDNFNCRKLNCEIDLKYKSFVQRGCLPVFHNKKCCPVDWVCPKLVKKIIKRSAVDDKSQTVKQDVFIVTPSKNLEEYLAEVKLSNEKESLAATSGPLSRPSDQSSDSPIKEVSTEATSPPTLSTNPFLPPNDSVTVPITIPEAQETTTQNLKSFIGTEASTISVETTNAPTASAETSTVSLTTEKTDESTTISSSVITVSSSTTAASTSASKTDSDDSDESKDSDEDENTNLFGEDVDDDEKKEKEPETTVTPLTETDSAELPLKEVQNSSSIESTQSSSTSEMAQDFSTTHIPLTTEALKEALKVLEQPDELTTIASQQTTFTSTSETTASPQAFSTTILVEAITDSTTIRELPKEPSTTTKEPSSTAPPTNIENVLPTEFEKLLTTLREFVAKADSATATESPKVEKQVEFVNFTVSSEKNEDGAKSISKRSVDDADLIPHYFKHQSLSHKNKVCVYDGRNFKVGEIIQTGNENLKCLCEYAPIGHCILEDK